MYLRINYDRKFLFQELDNNAQNIETKNVQTQEDPGNVGDELNLTEVFIIFYQQQFNFIYVIVNLYKTKKTGSMLCWSAVYWAKTSSKVQDNSNKNQTSLKGQVHSCHVVLRYKYYCNKDISLFYTAVQCDIPSYKPRGCSSAVR